jgi:hypothetical protein
MPFAVGTKPMNGGTMRIVELWPVVIFSVLALATTSCRQVGTSDHPPSHTRRALLVQTQIVKAVEKCDELRNHKCTLRDCIEVGLRSGPSIEFITDLRLTGSDEALIDGYRFVLHRRRGRGYCVAATPLDTVPRPGLELWRDQNLAVYTSPPGSTKRPRECE